VAASSRYIGAYTDACAGKSSLTVQYCEGHFVESYYPTIENSFSHEIIYKGQTYSTEIIDTAGQVSAGRFACTRK
jgi:Ras family protein